MGKQSRQKSAPNGHDNAGTSNPSIAGDVESSDAPRQEITSENATIGKKTNCAYTADSQDEGECYNLGRVTEEGTIGLSGRKQSLDLWIEDDVRACQVERKVFPPDCYSFLSLHGPFDNFHFFAFGLMVFLFQMSFLILIVLSVLHEKWRNNGDVDNPGIDIFASFIAANASPLVRATQMIAVLSYIVFADSSLMDVATGVETFPWRSRQGTKRMFFSCTVRFLQGCMASLAAWLTIITSETVIDIVLNFTALNFISQLDDAAFQLAIDGRYGPKLEAEAKRITELELPRCMSKGNKHRRFQWTLISVGFFLFAFWLVVVYSQESQNVWLTKVLRVEFQDESLKIYSGCYELNSDASLRTYKRMTYTSTKEFSGKASFGYCVDDNRWMLFNEGVDACSAGDGKLAYSTRTPAFDVSTSFDEGWYSASGTPLDLFFLELGDDVESQCSSFDNGVCNGYFNNYEYQYDGGDCCSATCSHPNCGIGAIEEAFGTVNATGKGFPHCKDPRMVPLTICLDNFTSSRTPSNMRARFSEYTVERISALLGDDYWGMDPFSSTLTLYCDEKNVLVVPVNGNMRNKTETVFVNDGASCTVEAANTTVSSEETIHDPPIWYYDVTIILGSGANISDAKNLEILQISTGEQGSSSFDILSIPECMFERLSRYTNMTTIYIDNSHSLEAVSWMIAENVECNNEFLIDLFALGVLNLGAPVSGGKDPWWIEANPPCLWAAIECNDETMSSLKLSQAFLSGTISTSIGLLTSLNTILLNGNSLTGQIPTEFGLLSSMETLILDHNNFTNVIPSEIGSLSALQALRLEKNSLSGEIPTEIGRLTSSTLLRLDDNRFVGTLCSEIGLLTSLNECSLEKNDFSGKLFSEIGMLSALRSLRFGHSSLTGEIPSEIGLLSSLKVLRFENSSLTGEIPTEIGMMSSVVRLFGDDTGLWGTMPSEIGLLSSIEILSIGSNELTGELPTEIGQFSNPKMVRFFQTNMTGWIPTQIGLWSSVEVLYLNDNEFNGKLFSEMGSLRALQEMDVGQNNLTGEIPSEIGLLPNITILGLANNRFYGTIPSELQFLNSSIENLTLAGNSLSGEIPSEIGALSLLETLDLANNILTGEIPSEVGSLSSLQDLVLDGNRLRGEIPSDIAQLQSLTKLVLENNLLSSTIPTAVGNLTKLVTIDFGNNGLTGAIPTEFGMMTDARHFSLASNTLKGLVPSEIGLLTLLTYLSIANNSDLSGLIPSELGLLSNLQCLDLDQEIFDSPIPRGVMDLLQASTCTDGIQLSDMPV